MCESESDGRRLQDDLSRVKLTVEVNKGKRRGHIALGVVQ